MEGKIKMIEKEIKNRRKNMKNKALMLGLGMGFVGILSVSGAIVSTGLIIKDSVVIKKPIPLSKSEIVDKLLNLKQKEFIGELKSVKKFRWSLTNTPHFPIDIQVFKENLKEAFKVEEKQTITGSYVQKIILKEGYTESVIYPTHLLTMNNDPNQRVLLNLKEFKISDVNGVEIIMEEK